MNFCMIGAINKSRIIMLSTITRIRNDEVNVEWQNEALKI